MKYIVALWRLVLIAYTSVVTTALQFFSCREVAGQSLMRTQLTIECGSSSHFAAAVPMAVVVGILILGLPLWLVHIMFNELGGERRLRFGEFKGVSFWVAICYQWLKLRVTSIPLCGSCCCPGASESEGYKEYLEGKSIAGWDFVEAQEKGLGRRSSFLTGPSVNVSAWQTGDSSYGEENSIATGALFTTGASALSGAH